jgi:hypothetical protein
MNDEELAKHLMDSFINELEDLMWRNGVSIIDTGAPGDSNPRFVSKRLPDTYDYPLDKYRTDQ